MVDTVMNAVTTLSNLVIEEADFLSSVSDKIVLLRDDLKFMQGFVKAAEEKQQITRDAELDDWVSTIRRVAQDAEDVLKTYIAKKASRSLLRNVVAKPINLHKLGKKIEKIQARLKNILEKKDLFDMINTGREEHEKRISFAKKNLKKWRHPSPTREEADLVDIEGTEQLMEQLLEPNNRVVSIVGMWGLGKTTLAKKFYNHSAINSRFDCKAFAYISKECNKRDTLQTIILNVNPDQDKHDLRDKQDSELVSVVCGLLEKKRYLVVLDDVWKSEDWDEITNVIPSGNKGSKVMITTRNMDVASYAHAGETSKYHELKHLNRPKSFELFQKKAFPGMDRMPSNFNKLADQMVAKCGGLPLALVALGGLLRGKTEEDWKHVLENIDSRLIKDDRISAILSRSYNDLSPKLQSCFLHLGLFPEDYSIPRTKLMHLWSSDEFLPQQKGKQMVDVADECLKELIDRCLVQIGTLTSLGSVKTVHIHDLLRDLSVSNGREQCFAEICNGDEVESSVTKYRRLAIHAYHGNYDFLKQDTPYLRSLQFFNTSFGETKLNFKRLKLLRILDVGQISRAIRPVGNLTKLRYLELDLEFYSDLRSIGNLMNLQTLKCCGRSCEVPDVIWKLTNLRHLLFRSGRLDSPPLGSLSHLQTLKYMRAGRWIEDGGLNNMINLRRLGLRSLSKDNVKTVISTIGKFQYLQSLSLNCLFPTTLVAQLSCCEHLQKLRLKGRLESLPNPSEFPPKLVKLSLYYSNLKQKSIAKLGRLPNLRKLLLDFNSYTDKKLVCPSQGFPALEVLHL